MDFSLTEDQLLFRKEIIRLIAEISMGAGTLAMIGGTVMSDSLGKGSRLSDGWPIHLTSVALFLRPARAARWPSGGGSDELFIKTLYKHVTISNLSQRCRPRPLPSPERVHNSQAASDAEAPQRIRPAPAHSTSKSRSRSASERVVSQPPPFLRKLLSNPARHSSSRA